DELIDQAREKVRAGKRKMEGRAPASPASQELRPPKQPGNAAPERAFQIINKTLSISPEQSLAFELDAIVELGKTESTQNLIRNFFLVVKYKKGRSKAELPRDVRAVFIGAGVTVLGSS